MKKIFKRGMLFLTAAAAIFCLSVGSVQAADCRANPEVSRKKVILYKGETWKLAKPSGKVAWKSENPSVVSVSKSGKLLAKKAGTSQVTAVSRKDKKTVKKVKVVVRKGAKKPSCATLQGVKQTDKSIAVSVRMWNRSNRWKGYGRPFFVERLENGQWVKLVPAEDMAFTSEMILIAPWKSAVESYTICSDDGKGVYQRKDFTAGTYRIHVDGFFEKDEYNYVTFTVQ